MTGMDRIPKPEWQTFFNRMSKALGGKWAEVEVASLELGDQILSEWIPLLGLTYDSKDDLVDVALDRSNHLIRNPRDIVVERSAAGIASVAVVDKDGARHIVRLKEPLKLAAS